MSITTAVCNSFKLESMQGVHEAGDTYMVALYTGAATINKSTTEYTVSGEVIGDGYIAGGMALTGYNAVLSGDTAYLDFTTDPVWTVASITARGCLIYNASKANRAVASYAFSNDVTSTAGNFTVLLPAPGASTALVRLT